MERTIGSALLVAGLAALLPLVAAAQEEMGGVSADSIVMSAGLEGGGYWKAGSRLQGVAKGLGLSVELRTSQGSLENLDRLADHENPVSLVFAQADALQYYLEDHPDFFSQIEILENIGQECVFIIAGSDSSIRTDADLQQAKDYRLGISSPTSGIAVTFDYMKRLTPELANTSAVYTDTRVAVEQLNDPANRPVDAVMLVHRPKELSPEVELAINKSSLYRFVKVRDPRLNKALPNGDSVYQSLDLAMPGGQGDSRFVVKTICVKGLLVANRQKLTAEQHEKLSQMVDFQWMGVYSTE